MAKRQGSPSGIGDAGSVHAVLSPESGLALLSRPEITERGLDDVLEQLYHKVTSFSEPESIRLLALLLEYEGQAFEVQCRLLSQHAGVDQMKAFVKGYNAEAVERRVRTLSYSHASDMARIGARLEENDKRMTRDYPLLTPSYYIVALRARDFIAALDLAQRKLHEAIATQKKDPDRAFPISAFRAEVLPPPKEGRKVGHPAPTERQDPPTPARAGLPEGGSADGARSAVEPSADGTPAATGRREEPAQGAPGGAVRTCYDCGQCLMIGEGTHSHQRIAVVNLKSGNAVDMVDELSVAWICRKTKRVLSVRTQVFDRAVAIAKDCQSFTQPAQAKPYVPSEGGATTPPEAAELGGGASGAEGWSEGTGARRGRPLTAKEIREALEEDDEGASAGKEEEADED